MQAPTNDLSPDHVRPFLMDKAVPRTGEDRLPGQYCNARHVWMYDQRPMVESPRSLPEMSTKTEAQIERDDVSPFVVLEMQTKTKAEVESDDEANNLVLLEMATKTSTTPERDD